MMLLSTLLAIGQDYRGKRINAIKCIDSNDIKKRLRTSKKSKKQIMN